MSQNSVVMPTTGTVPGLNFAQLINLALDSLQTNFSGPAAPSSPQAGQFWVDTSVSGANVLKMRNSANTAWTTLGKIDLPNLGAVQRAGDAMTGDLTIPSLNGGALAGLRNRIINGNFAINQRGVSGTVTLAAGAYGHDRWKAGAGGCTYTFATSGSDTVITITAGSLIQVIEDKNIEGGVYALSHAGTAQARIAVNGASTSGAYAAASQAAPLLSASATGGQQISIEFTTGTVSKVQLEPGSQATLFERRPIGLEDFLCKRYYEQLRVDQIGYNGNGTNVPYYTQIKLTPKRAAPSVSVLATAVATNTNSGGSSIFGTDILLLNVLAAANGSYELDRTYALSAEL